MKVAYDGGDVDKTKSILNTIYCSIWLHCEPYDRITG